MKITPTLWLTMFALGITPAVMAEARIGTGEAQALYEKWCASCHGEKMEGGSGSALIDDQWTHGASDDAIASSIKNGIAGTEMIAWRDTLSAEQIRSLVILIREQNHIAKRADVLAKATSDNGIYTSAGHKFTLKPLMEGTGILWSMSVLPDDSFLVSQKSGRLWHVINGQRTEIKNLPSVWDQGQGGLLAVKAHPHYEQNGWLYLSYAETSGRKNAEGRTVGALGISRGKLAGGALVEQQKIFEIPDAKRVNRGWHFGSRSVFIGNDLYFGIGDAGYQEHAQDLSSPNGKIHRIKDDGSIPKDNPFLKTPNAFPSVWSYGHRNPQGLTYNPKTQQLWNSEHGPRGGDELNVVIKGLNYGWPVITYGMNYDGTPISDKTHQDGMEQPKHYWTPSIAVSNIAFYQGNAFPQWRDALLVTSLSAQELRLVKMQGHKIVQDDIVLKNQGRVRDVHVSSKGDIYVIINNEAAKTYGVFQLVPID